YVVVRRLFFFILLIRKKEIRVRKPKKSSSSRCPTNANEISSPFSINKKFIKLTKEMMETRLKTEVRIYRNFIIAVQYRFHQKTIHLRVFYSLKEQLLL